MSRYGHISEEEFRVMTRKKIPLAITSGNPIVPEEYRSKLESRYAAHLEITQ